MEYKYAAARQAMKSSTRVDAADKFYARIDFSGSRVVAHEHVARSCHDLQSNWRPLNEVPSTDVVLHPLKADILAPIAKSP